MSLLSTPDHPLPTGVDLAPAEARRGLRAGSSLADGQGQVPLAVAPLLEEFLGDAVRRIAHRRPHLGLAVADGEHRHARGHVRPGTAPILSPVPATHKVLYPARQPR